MKLMVLLALVLGAILARDAKAQAQFENRSLLTKNAKIDTLNSLGSSREE